MAAYCSKSQPKSGIREKQSTEIRNYTKRMPIRFDACCREMRSSGVEMVDENRAIVGESFRNRFRLVWGLEERRYGDDSKMYR